MKRGRSFPVSIVLVSLAIFGLAPAAFGANCGLNLPCSQVVNAPGYGLWIQNDGDHALAAVGNKLGLHATSKTDIGVLGETEAPDKAGVLGQSYDASPGVKGLSDLFHGVYGEGFLSGVFGRTYNANWGGVIGYNDSAATEGVGAGTYGGSANFPGVYGKSTNSAGVKAESASNNGVSASSGAGDASGVFAGNTGGGWGVFGSTTSTAQPAIEAHNYGAGVGLLGIGGTYGVCGQTGAPGSVGVFGENLAGGPGVKGTSKSGIAGYFQITNAATGSAALRGDTVGKGAAGIFVINNATNANPALKGQTNGTGWAGWFQASGAGRGVYIKTAGGQGLIVSGGTKSAVVPTSKGERALYAEEASEVYFTDYGFGKLQSGKVVVPVDPLFAETVNLQEDYHVFVQAYGEADLYVTNCTPTSFEVRLRTKDAQGDGNVKFSYRLVGKRKGFETARLELAPVPPDPNSEKSLEKVAAINMP